MKIESVKRFENIQNPIMHNTAWFAEGDLLCLEDGFGPL